MTNPDRDELVKLADRLAALPTFKMATVVTVPGVACDERERDLIVTALRRLASSDGGVKGEPARWEWLHPHPIDGTDIWRTEQYWNGHTSKTSRPLYTAPPADAGMREALAYAERLAVVLWSKHSKDSAPNWKPLTGDLIGLLTQIDNMTAALTAPGATTKSDGESFVTTNPDGSVTLDAYAGKSRDELKTRCRELCSALNEWQFIAMEAATAHGNCLSNVPEHARTKIADMIEAYRDDDEPGPSDPSSTRSEVTVPCGLDRPSASQCPNMKEVGGGMDGERYSCAVCSKGYYLDYDDMR